MQWKWCCLLLYYFSYKLLKMQQWAALFPKGARFFITIPYTQSNVKRTNALVALVFFWNLLTKAKTELIITIVVWIKEVENKHAAQQMPLGQKQEGCRILIENL